MSASGVRLLLKFNFPQQIRFAGWSESYDLGFVDLPTAIAASKSISAFIVDRCNCLGQGVVIVEAVLSAFVQPVTPGAPPVRRSTVSFPIPPQPLPVGTAYNSGFNSDPKYVADFASTVFYMSAQTNLSSSPVYHRNLWIAGLPDCADQTNNNQVTEGVTLAAVDKFIGDLNNTNSTLGGKCGVSIRSIDRSGGNASKPCTAWNLDVNTYTVPAHGFVVGQPILAQGMVTIRGGSCPRGRYLVGTVLDVNTISLQGSSAPTKPLKLGSFRPAIVTFNQIQLVTKQGFTKRDKGRPSGLSVGRRRKPVTARA